LKSEPIQVFRVSGISYFFSRSANVKCESISKPAAFFAVQVGSLFYALCVEWPDNLLLERSASDIEDMPLLHVLAAFPRQVGNDPVGNVQPFFLLHRRRNFCLTFRPGGTFTICVMMAGALTSGCPRTFASP
jgi:hypothetical protein